MGSNALRQNYYRLDYLKLFCAFVVIAIHTSPLLALSEFADHIFDDCFIVYAVPIFYACTGFLLIVNGNEENSISLRHHIRKTIKKVVRLYLIWTAVYMPLTIYGWTVNKNLYGDSIAISAVKFIRSFLFVGENYYSWTLWYLNGLIVALLIIYVLSNKMTIKEMFILSSMLYAIGIGLNAGVTFSEYLSSSVSTGIALYFKAFVTTRNGLFQSFAFITTGMACGLATKQGSRLLISRHKFKSTAFKLVSYNDVSSLKSSTFVTAITLFIAKFACSFSGIGGGYLSQLLTLPTFCFLFRGISYWCMKSDDEQMNERKKVTEKEGTDKRMIDRGIICRKLSTNIYFVHMYFVALCALAIFGEGNCNNFYSFFIVCACATSVGLVMILIAKWRRTKSTSCHSATT